ncbi:extracellular solute-binding protein [Serratia microhaemolytica]|uniref:extracellular solute-binding protein n=1 Tax=Serratia microhaemolytica TaxID=2675110 RepID=UPI000FDF23E1|nr:extracellular solute-binding protein [Serratia microhaemolytica]
MLIRFVAALLLAVSSLASLAEDVREYYSFTALGEPKYRHGFQHFDYVNPDAPKGGDIRLAAIGTYDNFNRFASRGVSAERTIQLYDALFTTSDDEAASYYPLVAKVARAPTDMRWMEIELNPEARFHDGSPITAQDVAFTFNKFMTEGVAQFRVFYQGTQIEAVAPLTVRITLPEADKDKLLGLLTLPILSERFWQNYSLSEPLIQPPLSSGPYKISDYRLGQYVTYQRVTDYWAADLPVNRGQNNFDHIRYDYYLDDNVALEAFKSGAYDLRAEASAKNWATQYRGNNFDQHYIIKRDEVNHAAQNSRWLAFNVGRPIFADRRVREAITLAFDFEWMNKALHYQAYQRTDSYFQNTEYAATASPDAAELAWLLPLKDKLPPAVFGPRYQPPRSAADGHNRQNLLKASELLQQAGWQVSQRRLVHSETGQPFRFELLLPSGGNFQYVLPFQRNLKRLGIEMQIREVDVGQFTRRLRKRDFDMLPTVYSAMPFPNTALQILWDSEYLSSSWNTPGVNDAAVDYLVRQIVKHQGDQPALLSLGRALDRVLTWNHYMLPMWYSNHDRYAYWNKFSQPEQRPTYAIGLDTWWYDADKAATLPTRQQ